jgi:hypothetical protein
MMHDPFPISFDGFAMILTGGDCIDAPVDKHPETGFLEPFESLRFLFRGFPGEALDRR